MDREAIRECEFKDACATFNDGMIGKAMKGLTGFGCLGRNDTYRNEHCKVFRCKCLCVVLSDILASSPKPKTETA